VVSQEAEQYTAEIYTPVAGEKAEQNIIQHYATEVAQEVEQENSVPN
jgi:hypothetical protein